MERNAVTHNNYRLGRLGEATINILSFFDKTPLKYIGSGYWAEKYGLKAKELIDNFEVEARELSYNKDEQGLENLISNNKKEVESLTFKIYGSWLLRFAPVMPLYIIGMGKLAKNMINTVNENISNNYLNYLVIGLGFMGLVTLGSFVLHDFACPSSIRKYLYYRENGDERMANILRWAGFDARPEFEKVSERYKK